VVADRARVVGLRVAGHRGAATRPAWSGSPAPIDPTWPPPSLLVPALAAIQIGLGLKLMGRLRAAMTRPANWATVAMLNRYAMTLFLWHLTALMAGTVLTAG